MRTSASCGQHGQTGSVPIIFSIASTYWGFSLSIGLLGVEGLDLTSGACTTWVEQISENGTFHALETSR